MKPMIQSAQQRMRELGWGGTFEGSYIGQYLQGMAQHQKTALAMMWGRINGTLALAMLTPSSLVILQQPSQGTGEAISFPLFHAISLKQKGEPVLITCLSDTWRLDDTDASEVVAFQETLSEAMAPYRHLNRAV